MRIKAVKYSLFLIAIVLTSATKAGTYAKDTVLMGSSFVFTVVDTSAIDAYHAIDAGIAEVIRIEALISSWDPQSQTSQINANAGIAPVKVDLELIQLIQRANRVSGLTDGAFDLSFASIDPYWNFNGEVVPQVDSAEVQKSVALINYKNILINESEQTVFLKEPGMKIGFGAIGKGYAADKAKQIMKDLGCENGVVNAGGDLITWGYKTNDEEWTIGIIDPINKNKTAATLAISNWAVVTSGNYEKYVVLNGEKHGHIIDPKTGFPCQGIRSVTVMAITAEVGDVLATTVFVLGAENGIALIDQIEGLECIVITEENEYKFSKNINLHLINED